MLEINFLPASFYKAQQRRRQAWRHGFVIAMVGICVIGYGLWGGQGVYSLRREVEQLEAEVAMSRVLVTEVENLNRQRQRYMQQLSLERELVTPVMQSQVLSTISGLMPAPMALREIMMVCDSPRPITAAEQAKVAKQGKNNKPEPKAIPVIHVQMEGLSPSDAELADFVDVMSQHPLFSDVKMDYSRVRDTGRILAHEFRLEVKVRLDRDYRPAREAPRASLEEVAHVY